MNEIGRTVYSISGTILENSKRKMAAEKALAAIEKKEYVVEYWEKGEE